MSNWPEVILGGGQVRLINADCRDVLPTLGKIDAVISDPPYGIAFSHGGNDNSGIGGGRYATKFAKVEIVGDEGPFDPSPLIRIAPDIILWGGNHFADKLPPSPSWLVWDKRAASGHSNDFADCELAWSARKGVARVFRHHWDGMMKASERGIERVHPTQKPIALMVWCMEKIASEAQIILDPFMGSGTTGIAAVQLGRKFIGVEIERHYFDVACRRIQNALDQPNIFIERPKADAPKQETFL